jgi:hypothetical protein
MRRLRAWRAPLRNALLATMAWNNLLSFPYLYGYSLGTLDRLTAAYGFRRVHADGDVLTRLADAQSMRWAVWEERALKAACKIAYGTRRNGATAAPWIDAYYSAD